jgi:hypothetical protein
VKLRSIGSPTETNLLRLISIFFEDPTVLVVSYAVGVLRKDNHSVKLDSPFVSEPAYAALFAADNEEYNLVWNRDQRNSRR